MSDFYNNYLPFAQSASQRTGLDPRLILAQAAIESGWGKHAPGNNMFGIKSHGQAGGNKLATTEYGPNGAYRTADSFRAYDNPGDSFGGYADFMLANPRYKEMMGSQGLEAQAAALGKSGYATDPNYGSKVLQIAQGFPGGGGGEGGALSFAGEGGAKPPALSAIDNAAGEGNGVSGNGVLFQGEGPNRTQTVGAMLANAGAAIAGISNPSQGQSLRGIAQGLEQQANGQFQYQLGPNGQLIRIDKRTGTVDSRALPGGPKESFRPIMGKDENGNPTLQGTFNERTGAYKPAGGGNAAPAPMVGGDPNLEGQERYNTLSPEEKRQVDSWFNGTGIQPSQYSMRNNPKLQKLMDAATAVYGPEMDFQKYGERAQFIRGYSNKNPSHIGGQLVSVDHTAELVGQQADRYLKLDNSSGGPGGYGQSGANMLKNAMGGNPRKAVLDELKGASETLSGEYQTMIQRGKGGTGVEREEYAGNVHKPLAAPEVQAAGLQVMLDGLKARHHELVLSAQSAAGQAWLDKHPDVDKKITQTIEKVQNKIEALREKGKGKGGPINTPASAAPAGAPAIPSGWSVTGP